MLEPRDEVVGFVEEELAQGKRSEARPPAGMVDVMGGGAQRAVGDVVGAAAVAQSAVGR